MKKQNNLLIAASVFCAAILASPASTAFAKDSGWVNEDGDIRYYESEGYYAADTWKRKDNEWYYLDEDGVVIYDQMVDEYYVNEEGHRVTNEWIAVSNDDYWDSEYEDEVYWYYFGKDGQMVDTHYDKKINDNYYTFIDGHMQTGWVEMPKENTASASDASSVKSVTDYNYYDADGSRASGWRFIIGIDDIHDDEEHYFFFKNGKAYASEFEISVYTINSKRYGFDKYGIMQTGLKVVNVDAENFANFYFDDDGAMKTGKLTIYNEDKDENQTWYFHTEGSKRGQGLHGIRDNSIYEYGLRQEADYDLRYAPAVSGDASYLVNSSGIIQKATGSSKSQAMPMLGLGHRDYTDLNGKVWTVDTSGKIAAAE